MTRYSDKITRQELQKAGEWHSSNTEAIQKAEKILDDIEKDITSDLVTIPVLDQWGFPTGKTKLVSMSTDFEEIRRVSEAMNVEPEDQISEDEDPFLALEQKFAREKQILEERRNAAGQQVELPTSVQSKTPTPANTGSQTVTLQGTGLEFLTNPPSPPAKAVKLQLSGAVKFAASMYCHTFTGNDQLVVLVVDSRTKAEIIDLTLEDPAVEAALIFESGEKFDVYPPIPAVLTYDIGALRHFVFIRKHEN